MHTLEAGVRLLHSSVVLQETRAPVQKLQWHYFQIHVQMGSSLKQTVLNKRTFQEENDGTKLVT